MMFICTHHLLTLLPPGLEHTSKLKGICPQRPVRLVHDTSSPQLLFSLYLLTSLSLSSLSTTTFSLSLLLLSHLLHYYFFSHFSLTLSLLFLSFSFNIIFIMHFLNDSKIRDSIVELNQLSSY